MAVTTSTETANLGHATAVASKAWERSSRRGTVAQRFALPVKIPYGATAVRVPRWGAAVAASVRSENAVAVTATTLNTPAAPTASAAEYGLAIGITDQAEWRAIEENSPGERARIELAYANAFYLSGDSAVGIANYHYTQITNVTGTSGAALVRSTLASCRAALATTLDDDSLTYVCHIEGKGKADLEAEVVSAGAGIYSQGVDNGSPLSSELRGLFTKQLFGDAGGDRFDLDSIVLGTYFNGRVVLVQSPHRSELATVSSDKIGCMYLPYLPGLNGVENAASAVQSQIQPTFCYGYRADPAPRTRKTMLNVEDVPQGPFMHTIGGRAFNGVFAAVDDVIASANGGILFDDSGRRVRYAAT